MSKCLLEYKRLEGQCALALTIFLLPSPTHSGSGLCMVGGSMQTDKDIEGVTQTMGDYDPDGILKRHDKTRHMRQALVIR